MSLRFWIWVAIALAGCLNEPVAAPDEDNESLPEVLPASSVAFDDCTGVSILYRWPTGTNPGEPPSGWQESQPSLTTISAVFAMDCHRARIGELERPVSLVFEYHSNNAPPSACANNGQSRTMTLHFLGINDTAAAAYLTDVLSFPVQVIDFDQSRPGGGSETVEFSLSTGGVDILSGTIQTLGMESEDANAPISYYYTNQTGVDELEAVLTATRTDLLGGTFQGEAKAPLLLGQAPEPITTSGFVHEDATIRLEHRAYASPTCD